MAGNSAHHFKQPIVSVKYSGVSIIDEKMDRAENTVVLKEESCKGFDTERVQLAAVQEEKWDSTNC